MPVPFLLWYKVRKAYLRSSWYNDLRPGMALWSLGNLETICYAALELLHVGDDPYHAAAGL